MPHFCKLRHPASYETCDWDLVADPMGREAWLRTFDEHTDSLIDHARTSKHPPSETSLLAYAARFRELLDRLRAEPEACGPLTIYSLCKLRAEMMAEFGLGDPYDLVKHTENEAALRHLPQVLDLLDDTPDDQIVELLVRGLLAGNKFDLGAKDTVEQHAQGGIDFFATLNGLPPHPWFIDDLEQIKRRLGRSSCRYRKAIFFVDNAGGDVVLGAIPLARYLAELGCVAVLAANDEPSLNDITVDELATVLDTAAAGDSALTDYLAHGMITTVGTGCDCPLIDLSDVTDACNEAARDCDLVILEGMGRAIESNFDTPFTCDAIRLAMIKNRDLAAYLGCQLFGLIAGHTPAGA
jgi:type II pantothenate kinase